MVGNDRLSFDKEKYYWTILRNHLCGISRSEYKKRMGPEYESKNREYKIKQEIWRYYKVNKLSKRIEYETFKELVDKIYMAYKWDHYDVDSIDSLTKSEVQKYLNTTGDSNCASCT